MRWRAGLWQTIPESCGPQTPRKAPATAFRHRQHGKARASIHRRNCARILLAAGAILRASDVYANSRHAGAHARNVLHVRRKHKMGTPDKHIDRTIEGAELRLRYR